MQKEVKVSDSDNSVWETTIEFTLPNRFVLASNPLSGWHANLFYFIFGQKIIFFIFLFIKDFLGLVDCN